MLTTLTIESIAENVYSVVELVDKANEQHCRRARADEIIIGSELFSHLLAAAALAHGISNIVSELLSSHYGNELYTVALPENLAGKAFIDVMIAMKQEQKATVLGIQKGLGGELITNPESNYLVDQQDKLIIIASERPGAQ